LTAQTQVPFLEPDLEQIRHQITGILDSYTHDWDLLAEISQNAVDSISRAAPVRGHIKIRIDATTRTVEISDNGTGIDPADLPRLLRPFGTNKVDDPTQIGQKGVGLTFVVFSSSGLELETHHANGSAIAKISGAAGWLDSKSDSSLYVEVQEIAAGPHGLKLTIRLADADHPLWSLSFHQILFALRTRTALGSTHHIWGEPLNCDFSLHHVDLSGISNAIESDCNYLLPTEKLPAHEMTSLEEYSEWLAEQDRSDIEKRKRLKDKILYSQGNTYQAGRNLKFWTCFVPTRDVWRTLSALHGILDDSDDTEKERLLTDEISMRYEFSSGLQTSSKGMPTGIALDLKPRGSAGYVPNFFILIEDPSLSFDIGRKSIQSRQQGMLRELAFKKFREFLAIASKYISGSVGDSEGSYNREELLEEIKELPDLDSPVSSFVKRPNQQEATVAGMFFEQLGRGAFAGFKPLISGYKGKYDLYGRIDKKFFVVEFKFDLFGLFRDFSDERKLFDEIDMVVVWDITERDWKALASRGLALTEIAASSFGSDGSRFPGAHYLLQLAGVKPVEVFCMHRMLKPPAAQ